MNTVINNIKRGIVFNVERYDNELLTDVYKSINNLDTYNISITPMTYRKSITFYFTKALREYKKTHQLS